MKKIVPTLSVLIASISFYQAFGQEIGSGNNRFYHSNNLQNSQIVINKVASLAITSENKKAGQNFAHTYTSNIQPVWSLRENGGCTASFIEADIQNSVFYDKAGNRVCNIRRYDESKMSPELRQVIKPVYYDYTITGIAEITATGNTVYLVYLTQNATEFKTVRVSNGEMELIEWIKDNKMMSL